MLLFVLCADTRLILLCAPRSRHWLLACSRVAAYSLTHSHPCGNVERPLKLILMKECTAPAGRMVGTGNHISRGFRGEWHLPLGLLCPAEDDLHDMHTILA